VLGRRDAAVRQAKSAHEALRTMRAEREAERAAAILRELDASEPAGAAADLTPREVEVLALVAQGLSNPEIAAQLVISEHTAHRHLANILRKLDLPSRAAAAAWATRHGLV
jgi:LuxR family transcriptional regulator, maltose regulon positive regulatory protein